MSAAPRRASLILSGGVGLGAFQAGAFEVLARSPELDIRSVSGASIGALNGAIIAGNAPENRVAKLRVFWDAVSVEAVPMSWLDPLGLTERGPLRRARNWGNVLTTTLLGSRGLFRLRSPFNGDGESRSFYDNRIARRTLEAVIDFDRLNAGEVRFCLAATDIEAGEPVFFDTDKGDRIGTDHLIASSSLVPAFEPIRIGNRLLADGGMAGNVPLEAEIGPDRRGPPEPLCLVLDLFTPEGNRPEHLNRSTERGFDVFFGMQTRMRLAAFEREWALRAELARARPGPNDAQGVDLLYMGYRGPEEDAGFGKPFDLSPATLRDRWREGSEAAERAIELVRRLPQDEAPGLRVHRLA